MIDILLYSVALQLNNGKFDSYHKYTIVYNFDNGNHCSFYFLIFSKNQKIIQVKRARNQKLLNVDILISMDIDLNYYE